MKNRSSNKIDLIAIVGPTASGKTSYSIELAKELGGEIVSADSRLVYRGFDIATAKPSLKERCGVPHYMIDIVEPEFDYSAALYKDAAEKVIEDISKRGKTPILVGGTGLYIDVLLKNYQLPRIVPNRILRDKLYSLNNDELYSLLLKKDHVAAQNIDINDKKKIIRTLEIIETAGQTLDKVRGISDSKYNVKWIGRNFERKELYERINTRVELMFENGIVDETKRLLEKHGRIANLVCTIGYKEVTGYIDGLYSLEEAKEFLKQNTRRYAKRQLTWFRRNSSIEWNVYPEILKK